MISGNKDRKKKRGWGVFDRVRWKRSPDETAVKRGEPLTE